MPADIVLIPGALATPEISHHLVNQFAGKQFHHVNLSDSDSIEEMGCSLFTTTGGCFQKKEETSLE